MNKITKIILIISILIITSLVIWGFLFYKNQNQNLNKINNDEVKQFSFFGFLNKDSENYTEPNINQSNKTDTEEDKNDVFPKLRKISIGATAGATVFTKKILNENTQNEEYHTFVRYVETETGHIYEININTMKQKRVSNTTIPKIQEAFFEGNGEFVIVRYFNEDTKTINTFSAKIIYDEDIGEGSINGSFLTNNISSITSSKEKIFYLEDLQTYSLGFIAMFDGSEKKQIFNSPFTEWLTQWENKNIFITTKPSFATKGFMYSITEKGASFEKIIGNVFGLTTLVNNTGTKVLYSESTKGGFVLNSHNIKTKKTTRIPFETLPEKCVWSNDSVKFYCAVPERIERADYPDDWYKGLLSFSDNIWVFDTETKVINILAEPYSLAQAKLDIIKPFLSEDGKYLFFTNKKDRVLWVLEL